MNTTVCTVLYTVPYTILYADAKSGITKFIVFLTEPSTVNLSQYPSLYGIKYGVHKIYSRMYISLYCTVFSTMYIRQWLVLLIEKNKQTNKQEVYSKSCIQAM